MKRIVFFRILLFWVTGIFSQGFSQIPDFCGTDNNVPNYLDSVNTANIKYQNYYVIRIYVHIVRDGQCQKGLTYQEVADALNILREDFAPHGICFSLAGIDEICNDQYYYTLFSVYDIHNIFSSYGKGYGILGIDIFLLGHESAAYWINSSGGGYTGSIPDSYLLVSGNGGNYGQPNVTMAVSHALSHEMGHCLGLYHTNYGYCKPFPTHCLEHYDGSNCATCGDYVCDTPADPQAFSVDTVNCEWDSTKFCNYHINSVMCSWKGQTFVCYKPDTRNIMGYVPFVACMDHFTPGQGERMRSIIPAYHPDALLPDSLGFDSLYVTNGDTLLHDAYKYITAKKVIVSPTSGLELKAGRRITIKDGTKIDGYFLARIDTSCNFLTASNIQQRLAPPSAPRFEEVVFKNYELKVHPNPAKDILHIEYPFPVHIILYDIPGTPLLEKDIIPEDNQVDIRELPVGMYILKTFDRDGNLYEFTRVFIE